MQVQYNLDNTLTKYDRYKPTTSDTFLLKAERHE